MNVRIAAQTDRRFVWLHIGATAAMEPRGMLHFVRRLNRFLVGSGLFALSQGNDRILLLGLKGAITSQDTGLVMLWLWRQPQVAALGIEKPTPHEVHAAARLGHAGR
ncbi:hypothetical protein D621_18090 [beta proteobacterium AAP51]|nr:hypothetical protein D621_18090 [beta proteobacterium AAP51]